MASIRDVARRAGVSVSTVSYVLNGGPKPVSPKSREKVQKAIQELDFRPSMIARSLTTGRTGTIGVICPYSQNEMLGDQFFATVLRGIVNEAQLVNLDVLLYTRIGQRSLDEVLSSMVDGRTDGILVVASAGSDYIIEQLQKRSFPFIGIWVDSPSGNSAVQVDNAAAVELALDHLAALGHRRIGHLAGPEEMFDARVRIEAFRRGCQLRSLETHEEWMLGPCATEPSGAELADELLALEHRPTAVVAFNDAGAIGFMHRIAERGHCVPGDFSVVGFDDMQAARECTPKLTTIAQPVEQMGRAAVRALNSQMGSGVPMPSEVYVPTLVVRDSTAKIAES